MSHLPLPAWVLGYQVGWLRFDLIAGLVIWSVVTPQAVAYAQIAGLPPEAGLMAAPGAMFAYALLGTSRQLVVSATTATSAVSAATVGALAGGDTARFAALSAAFALVTAVVLVLAGVLRLGAVSDLVSKPVMTGFLFGLGLTIMVSQLADVLGVPGYDGNFFPKLWHLIGDLGDVHLATLAVGAGSIALLVAGRHVVPRVPMTLVVLALGIALSALLDLDQHGVDVVGDIPDALPDPAIPHVGADDVVNLIAPAFGVLILGVEAVGVARGLAVKHDYHVDSNRDLVAMGGSNLLAGLSSGFVQSGGASQTAAADGAGGRTQLASLICVVLLILTGAFLAPLFKHLPQATLAAIVVVAVSGFFDVREMRRFGTIRHSGLVWALVALVGVLVLGILQGLVVTAGATLFYIVQRLARPAVHALARDPVSGDWGAAGRHPSWAPVAGVLAVHSDGPLLYPNANAFEDRVMELVAAARPAPRVVVIDLSATSELDVQAADTLSELNQQLQRRGIELRLAAVREPVRDALRRTGLADEVELSRTMREAVNG